MRKKQKKDKEYSVKIKELEGAIEAILFAMGESVELSRIAKAINMDTKTTEKLIHNMMDRYEQEERGIQIIELGDSYQMCTRKKYRVVPSRQRPTP